MIKDENECNVCKREMSIKNDNFPIPLSCEHIVCLLCFKINWKDQDQYIYQYTCLICNSKDYYNVNQVSKMAK